jgi:hypothetical protein
MTSSLPLLRDFSGLARPEPRLKCSSLFTLVGTAKLSFGQDVTVHRALQFLLGRAELQ